MCLQNGRSGKLFFEVTKPFKTIINITTAFPTFHLIHVKPVSQVAHARISFRIRLQTKWQSSKDNKIPFVVRNEIIARFTRCGSNSQF